MRAVRVDAIQVLRLFAALLVVVDHSLGSLIYANRLALDKTFAWDLGGFGVKIFFLISGFVMVHSTIDRFGQPGAPRAFLVRRFLRIAPIYWLVTVLAIVKDGLQREWHGWAAIVASFLFFPLAAADGSVHPIYGIGWTLNYEMFFYLIFTGCLLLRPGAGLTLLVTVMLGLVGLGAIGAAPADASVVSTAARFWTEAIQLYFIGGIALGGARVALERAGRGVHLPLPVLTVAMLAGILAFMALRQRGPVDEAVQFMWCLVIVAVCGLANSEATSAPTRLLREFGDASYSIYLTHGFVYPVLAKLWLARWPDGPALLFLAISLAACSIAGLMTYRWVERPMLRALQRRFQQPVTRTNRPGVPAQ